MIGLCTDSTSQIPADLAARFGVAVVPLTVTVDERDYLDGVDLDADDFYAMFDDGRKPAVSASQPSPGQFALAYDELIGRGCTEILSIHICSAISGTVNSARLGSHGASVPIRVVDSGTGGFGVSCCVWATAEAIDAGASIDEAAAVAESLAPSIGNMFVVGGLDHMQAAGYGHGLTSEGVPVLSFHGSHVDVIARAETVDDAVAEMARRALASGPRVRVGVGFADRGAEPIAAALAEVICADRSVVELVHYRIGPAVGAHTGPGTAGCFVFPA